MPVQPTYPGVYIEELPSDVRTIVGVATSITAFLGRARKGTPDHPTVIHSFGDFVRYFGAQWRESTMSYAVEQFFRNGGSTAVIVRVHRGAATASCAVGDGLVLDAASPGSWGGLLRASIDHDTATADVFNLAVWEVAVGDDGAPDETRRASEELFRNVSADPAHPRFVHKVVDERSQLARVTGDPAGRPAATSSAQPFTLPVAPEDADGDPIEAADVLGDENAKTGMHALLDADLFNILCIPPLTFDVDVPQAVWQAAATFCESHRAMLLVDPPVSWTTVEAARDGVANVLARGKNAAIYFPRVKAADSQQDFQLQTFAPCGIVAGIFARTDSERGVWKAPAGLDATLRGISKLDVALSDGENGQLNPIGVNCLRTFPGTGTVVWGARTREGADNLASQWKYVPIRRLALFIEESLFRGTQWVVFEPNDEPLWAQIRLNVGAFMHNLFRQGAFEGTKPRDAYLVRCDGETTTADDRNRGVVNILVGFAPLKPAEFVIIKIQQLAGQLQA